MPITSSNIGSIHVVLIYNLDSKQFKKSIYCYQVTLLTFFTKSRYFFLLEYFSYLIDILGCFKSGNFVGSGFTGFKLENRTPVFVNVFSEKNTDMANLYA